MSDIKSNKVGLPNWLTFIIAGLVGQFAWTIENMYLNRYLFYVTGSTDYISAMVAASAVTATLTTLLMGALCDRLGKRKPFIFIGYIIWGISIISFAFLDNPALKGLSFVGPVIVILDCLMTFFGSTANDAAFNAYVTDATNDTNRGKVESVLSILPLVSMLIIFGLFTGMTSGENPQWPLFYYIFGGATIAVGILLIFIMPKDTISPNKSEPYIKNIFYGFRPKTVKSNPMLYLMLLAFAIFNIGTQIFYPYFLIYIEHGLKIQGTDFIILMGSVLLVACILTVVFGLFMDKIGKNRVLIPSIAVTSVGCLLMFFSKEFSLIIPSGIVMMSGLMISTAALGAKVRDYTPENEVGLFQGIRMIFTVLLPMVTGPYIGEALYKYASPTYYENEFGQQVIIPNSNIFLGASIAILLTIIPIIFIIIKEKKNEKSISA